MAKATRFTQIHLENWRNFAKAAADLEHRAVLVGPTASGKSNLLDAFRFLHDVAAMGGGFQQAVRRRGGVPKLRCLAARQSSDVVIRVCTVNEARWEYELAFTHSEELQCPVIQRERVSVGQPGLAAPLGEDCDIFCRPDAMDREDPERLTQTYLEQSTTNQRFRELVEVLRSVRYVNMFPAQGLIEQIAGTPENTQHGRLRRILMALLEVAPQLTDLQMWRDAGGAPHLRARYEHWRSRGAWQTEEQFSEGTLRLIGLLWAALDGAGPLLLEEPEVSLDPHIIRSIPDMIGRMLSRSGRQAILTTHSTELLESGTFEANEVLLLTPGEGGTEIHAGVEFPLIERVMAEGLCLAEVMGPEAPVIDERQISLFEEDLGT